MDISRMTQEPPAAIVPGSCRIDVNRGARELSVQAGQSLLKALDGQNIFLPSACGGRGICQRCKVKVLQGAGPVSPGEAARLSPPELEEGMRLACQVRLQQDLQIEIDPELLTIREYRAVVQETIDLTHDVRRFRLRLLEPKMLRFTPGQYVQLNIPAYPGNSDLINRAYSIASDPVRTNTIDLIIRRVLNGTATTFCFDHLRANDAISLSGPYGDFRLSDSQADIVFVAGGSGMAPIESMLHQMRNTKSRRRVTYFFGGNTVRDIFMLDEMRQFEQDLPNFRFVPVVANIAKGDDWTGERGLVTEAVERYVAQGAGVEAYLCGSPGMIDATVAVLAQKGVADDRIFFDKFS